jgi:hypothetical protein
VIVAAHMQSAQTSDWTAAAIATLVAAGVSALITVIGLWVAGRRQARERRRDLYAKALSACMSYREFPYVVRRRQVALSGHEEIPGAERTRISESMREVQEELSHYTVWLDIEQANDVADAYRALVAQTRIVAGGYIRSAWDGPGLNNDAGVNQTQPLDYRGLKPYEDEYLAAVRRALSWTYRPRRFGRWIKKSIGLG